MTVWVAISWLSMYSSCSQPGALLVHCALGSKWHGIDCATLSGLLNTRRCCCHRCLPCGSVALPAARAARRATWMRSGLLNSVCTNQVAGMGQPFRFLWRSVMLRITG